MSVKSVPSILCNHVQVNVFLLCALFLMSYFSFSEGSGAESVKISRDENATFPEMTIPQGKVQGINMITRNNRTVFGFLGVPYGQPPIGDLRFKAPLPANGWNGTWNASTDSEPCPQFADGGVDIIGNEDCLYLNLYTPQLPITDNSSLLPVMFFVVGGGFKTEIVSPVRYGPYFLLDKDVLLVAPNFRAGVLGYLSTGDEVSPGNYGLKDIVCALEWVRDNIQHFGGDPNQVTLFGGSSGAMSVHLLTLSNLTNGLFHRHITQSGTAFNNDVQQSREVHVNRTFRLGEYFNCSTSTSTLLVDCLRGLNVSQLLDTNPLFYEWKTYSPGIWLPTYEPDIEGALLTDTPANLIASGNISDLPWISLVTRDEGNYLSFQYYEDPDLFEEFLENIDTILPIILAYGHVVDDVPAYTDALKSYYLNDLTADRSLLLDNLTELISDSFFIYPAYKAFQKQLVLAESPQYFCSFEYRGTFSFSYFYTGSTEYDTIAHADDLIYIFGHQEERLGPAEDEFNDADWAMVDNMVQLWTSFATNGTPIAMDSVGTIWEPYSSLNNYLRIGNGSDTSLEMKYNLHLQRMQFWDELSAATTTTATSGGFRCSLQALTIGLCLYLFSFLSAC